MKKFNYCVGRYWNGKDGQVSVYAYGSEVHYGTMEDAIAFRDYVKQQSPEHNWKIFELSATDE